MAHGLGRCIRPVTNHTWHHVALRDGLHGGFRARYCRYVVAWMRVWAGVQVEQKVAPLEDHLQRNILTATEKQQATTMTTVQLVVQSG